MAFSDPLGLCNWFLSCLIDFGSFGLAPLFESLLRHNPWLGQVAELTSFFCGPFQLVCLGAISLEVNLLDGEPIGRALEGAAINVAEAEAFPIVGVATAIEGEEGGNVKCCAPEFFENMAGHALAGGTFSVIRGGKFGNGALTGAFGYLFNACGGQFGCTAKGLQTGTAIGLAASVGCDIGTGGACVLADPIITVGVVVVGGTVGLIKDIWSHVVNLITPRPDLPTLYGGRSGQLVPGLTRPPNSAIPGPDSRIFVTEDD